MSLQACEPDRGTKDVISYNVYIYIYIVQRRRWPNRITNSPHHNSGEAVNWYNDLPVVPAESV